MGLLQRLFFCDVPTDEIGPMARSLPLANVAPDECHLRCLRESRRRVGTCDGMDASLWQDTRTNQLWVRYTGSVAQVDLWYGPGDTSLLEAVPPACR